MSAPVWPAVDRRGVMGQSGMSMLDLRFLVEQAHYARGGVQWVRQGLPHVDRGAANDVAAKLRAQGFRVRVRPIVG